MEYNEFVRLWCGMQFVVPDGKNWNHLECFLQNKTAGEHTFKGWQIFWNLQWEKLCRSKMTEYLCSKTAKNRFLSGKKSFICFLNRFQLYSLLAQTKSYS